MQQDEHMYIYRAGIRYRIELIHNVMCFNVSRVWPKGPTLEEHNHLSTTSSSRTLLIILGRSNGGS